MTADIEAWGSGYCRPCKRTRIHYRDPNGWACVGTLPEGKSKPCGEEL